MKAILVMDMPESCIGCPLNDYMRCKVKPTVGITVLPQTCRPTLCPLKPMPERKNYGELDEEADEGELTFSYWSGWNACIDVIEGSKDK